MSDHFHLDVGQSIQSNTGVWYRNLQRLGVGGNAVTFLVVATSGGNRGVLFAVKVFRRLSKPERRDGFLGEMRFLQACDHPSVMRVVDDGIYRQAHPFLVAEYLPDTLFTIIRADQTSLGLKVSFALQLLSALAYLENADPPVIHRDIKPQNIFVKGRSCVLGDFGLMKHAVSQVEDDIEFYMESVGAGMPARYRTPDLVDYLNGRARLTPRSDVFQLGLVLAELLTGRNPLKPAATFTEPIELESLRPAPGGLAPLLGAVLARMLTPEPANRPAPHELLNHWEGIFRHAVQQAHALEGRAIWQDACSEAHPG